MNAVGKAGTKGSGIRRAKTFSELRTECGLGCKSRDNRGSSTERGYGSRWQRRRAAFLKKNPLCIECKRDGRTEAATRVDHIDPHKGDPVKFWDEDNWQPMCQHHHDSKTARQDGGFGHKRADASSTTLGGSKKL